jgi:peptide/nickel transport system permease protein
MEEALAPGLELSPRLRQLARFRRRFLGRPLAVVGLVLVALFVLVAILAPWIAPYSPDATHYGALLRPPLSRGFLLGTDELGRDELTRILWGSRVSLEAGVFSTLLAVAVGLPVGLASGYYRGWVDPVVMRLTDLVLAFPYIIVAVGLAAILGASLRNVVIALAIAQIPAYVRIARGEALAVREEDYVAAAAVVGASDWAILRRHLLPNVFSPILVQATATVPAAILGEALLSFLGLGVQPPTPSWGTMLSDAQSYLQQAPYLALLPGIAIFLATLAFNLLGDGIRDLLDPKGFAR